MPNAWKIFCVPFSARREPGRGCGVCWPAFFPASSLRPRRNAMLTDFFRWLGQNVGSLLLAFILSVVVWITAQVSEDPNEQRVFPRNIPLQLVGRDADLFVYGDIPDTVRVTLYAPQSVWTRLTNNPDSVEAWIDISGLEPGTTHVVP